MKKFRRILSVTMSVIMLLCMLSISSFAATGVQRADLSINIEPGMSAADYESYITIETDGLEIGYFTDDYDIIVWHEDGYSYEDDFEIGCSYYIEFYLNAEDGYFIPDSEFEFEGVFVNGEAAEYVLIYDDVIEENAIGLGYYVELGGSISQVDLTVDIYDEMPAYLYDDFITSVPSGLYYYYGNFDCVNVYDSEGESVEVFEEGETYTIEMFFEPKTNCSFAKNDSGEFDLDSVTVNGEAAEYIVDSYSTNGYYEYIKVIAEVTAKSANYIKELSFDISTDLDGVSVYDWENYITINTDNVLFECYLDDPAVYASDVYGNDVEEFRKGQSYNISIFFSTQDGYFFPFDGELDNVTINGEGDYYDYFFGSYIAPDGTERDYICVEYYVDVIGDGFFDQIIFFFRTLFEMIRAFFLGY